jgi:membrane-associated phospholipid phosphatase
MWQYCASLLPITTIVILFVFGYTYIAATAIVLAGVVEIIKIATIPYINRYPWLKRPKEAKNCSCINTGGYAGNDPGFPSGHAAVITYTVLALALIASTSDRPLAYAIAVVAIFMVSASRIARKCHTIPQVVAGIILGALTAMHRIL